MALPMPALWSTGDGRGQDTAVAVAVSVAKVAGVAVSVHATGSQDICSAPSQKSSAPHRGPRHYAPGHLQPAPLTVAEWEGKDFHD